MKIQPFKIFGMQKSSPKREIHRNTSIHSKTGKNSNTNLTLHIKELEKKQQIDPTPKRRRELIKLSLIHI